MTDFNQFFDKVLKVEGGYANNPNDRGGETFAGVSSRYFAQDVQKLKQMHSQGQDTEPYLRDFYKREFWDKSNAEQVPDDMRMAYADTAVNSGIGKAKELLSQSSTPNEFLDNRQTFVKQVVRNDPSQAEFQNGWKNRIDSMRGGQGQDTIGRMRGGQGQDTIGRRIKLPDGRSISLTGSETPEQLTALKDKLRTTYQPQPQAPQEKASQGNDMGALAAAGIGISGGQIPFGNKITSGIGAGIATAFDAMGGKADLGFKDYYNQSLADTKATQEANPKATLAGNLMGVGTTLPAAFSKAPQGSNALANTGKGANYATQLAGKVGSYSPFQGAGKLAKAGNLGTRAMGRALVAAPATGAYFAGEADKGEMGQEFKKGLGVGAGASVALPVAGAVLGAGFKGSKNIAKGIGARTSEVLDETLGSMKDVARGLYKKSDKSGAVLTPSASQGISSAVSGIVKNSDTQATKNLYKGTLKAIDQLNDDLAVGNIGLETLDAHRQILGNIAKDITNPNKAQEAEMAGRVIRAIDDSIDQLTPQSIQSNSLDAIESLTKARKQWSQSKKFEAISDIISKAGGDANKLKRDIERFASNKKNTLGWSKDELDALKFAGNQTTGEGILKMAGKFGFDIGSSRSAGNTALPLLTGGAVGGISASVAPALAVPLVGTAARAGQKYLARGKAEKLLKALEAGGVKSGAKSTKAQGLAKRLQSNSTPPMTNIVNQNVGVR